MSIDSLFEGKDDELILIFDKLLSEIVDWENVAVSATQNCIVFVHNQTFLIIRPMKKQLDLKFYSESERDEFPVVKSIFYSGKFENHIRISSVNELSPQVFSLIRDSYRLL
ncbi:MAG: DUF5655 domain-containing protein [Sediminibacterium sp.]